jgi:hypothetical protein
MHDGWRIYLLILFTEQTPSRCHRKWFDNVGKSADYRLHPSDSLARPQDDNPFEGANEIADERCSNGMRAASMRPFLSPCIQTLLLPPMCRVDLSGHLRRPQVTGASVGGCIRGCWDPAAFARAAVQCSICTATGACD